MHYIYAIINKINGKIYIGQSKNPKTRFTNHKFIAKKYDIGNKIFYSVHESIKKYGNDNFIFEVIESCAKENVNDREKFWIHHCYSNNPEFGYNLTTGGNSQTKRNQEGIERRRQQMIGVPLSEEHKANISKGNIGLKRSPEVCEKLSAALKGVAIGRRASKETRDKLSAKFAKIKKVSKRKNIKNPNAFIKNLEVSEETRAEIRDFYSTGEYSLDKLANVFNLNKSMIVGIIKSKINILSKNELIIKQIEARKNADIAGIDSKIKDSICFEYKNTNITKKDLAEKFLISHENVVYILKFWNKNKNSKYKRISKHIKSEIERLYFKYKSENVPKFLGQIAIDLKIDKNVVVNHISHIFRKKKDKS